MKFSTVRAAARQIERHPEFEPSGGIVSTVTLVLCLPHPIASGRATQRAIDVQPGSAG